MEVAAVGWGISMAGWIISPYITRLLNKANSHVEVDANISELVTHLIPQLKFTLETAESSRNTATLGKLVSKLKSAFHDTEDILDELEYIRHFNEASQRKKKARQTKRKSPESSPSNKFPPLLKADLRKNVKTIRKLVDEAWKTLSSENGGHIPIWGSNLPNGSESAEHRPSASPAGRVIGRDDVRNDIMKLLEHGGNQGSSDKCLSVIGIYGLPGSGKTTLAQHIFAAAETAEYFNLVMWIHVSEKFSVDHISKQMFQQAWEGKEQCPQHDNLVVLQRELKKLLFGKRFLLVLDDVWCSMKGNNDKKLPHLLLPLMTANRGSKILVTGRLEDAVFELGPEVRIIDNSKIPELDDKVFLELFMHHAFGHKERYQPLVTVGTRIAQKLKKSPLLAKAVGGVLRKKQDVRRWQSFEEQKIWEKHMGPLLWCYQNLDEQAKRCFAYCSIFPRGRHLYRHELVNLWVAEGFISTTEGGWDMECVSEDVFDELLSVSFLQPGAWPEGKNEWDKDYFVIHDLLHDLAEKVAGSDCFKIENALAKAPSDVLHLSIKYCSASMITEDIIKLKNLRTLIIYSGEGYISYEVLERMFMELTKLRVLILENVCANFPGSIKYLKHLRYLCVHKEGWIVFPSTIGELYLLQVLDSKFVVQFQVSEGVDMASLTNLRHVICYSDVPFPNIGRLTSLRTMPLLNVERGDGYELHQLGDLNNLRGELRICCLESVNSKEEALRAKLADKRQVKSLYLCWTSEQMTSPGVHADVLEGLCPPEGLECMTIMGYKGSRYPEWMFGPEKSKMYLHTLRLQQCDKLVPAPVPELFFVGVTSLELCWCDWDAMPYNMVHLTDLLLYGSSCDALPDNMDQLTSLKRLIIRNCWSFRRIPALPTSLEYFELAGCDEEFTRSCKDADHPNYKAIEHIPEKNFVGRPFEE